MDAIAIAVTVRLTSRPLSDWTTSNLPCASDPPAGFLERVRLHQTDSIAENGLQLLRRDRLIGAVADPGLGNMAQSRLLEAGEESAKPGSRPRCPVVASAEHVHQHAAYPGR
jgi:hypothetical protein